MEEIVLRLISLLEDASPALWDMARRQVYASVVQAVLVAFLFLVLSVVFWRFKGFSAKRTTLAHSEDRWFKSEEWHTGSSIISGIAASFCLFLAFIIFIMIVGHLMNPDYYALRALLDIVR